MSKNSLNDWSTTAASNTDIAGTNIAVGCPPQDVGVFMRTVMAQIAYAVQGSGGAIPATWNVGTLSATTGSFSGNVTVGGTLTPGAINLGSSTLTVTTVNATTGTFLGNVSITGTLTPGVLNLASGTLTAGAVVATTGSISGGLSAGSLSISGGASVGNGLTVSAGGSSITGGLSVTGAMNASGTATIGGDVVATGVVTAANGTSGTQAVNFGQFPVTFGPPGTTTLPNGYIRKWGTATLPASGQQTSTVAITFGTAFPSALMGASVTMRGPADNAGLYHAIPFTGSETKSGFTAGGDTNNASVTFAVTVPVYWEAWGH